MQSDPAVLLKASFVNAQVPVKMRPAQEAFRPQPSLLGLATGQERGSDLSEAAVYHEYGRAQYMAFSDHSRLSVPVAPIPRRSSRQVWHFLNVDLRIGDRIGPGGDCMAGPEVGSRASNA